VLSLLSQQISIDGYAETDPTLSTYPEQDPDSLIGSVGWQASYSISEHLQPYAQITGREFEEAPEQASRRRSRCRAAAVRGAGPGADDTFGTLVFGL
jgi:outer membrane lipase/esterase